MTVHESHEWVEPIIIFMYFNKDVGVSEWGWGGGGVGGSRGRGEEVRP